jgi:predicted Zn-dependent protease
MALRICALVVTVSLSVAPIRTDCQANVATATHVETGDELDARLTATQRQQFDAAKKAQLARQYAEASAGFKALLQDLPGDSLLTKWASDAALDMGDSAYALGVLKPLVLANFEDWQAVAMLARAAAEQGDRQTRDAAMMNIVMLRQHGLAPPNMTQYVLERMKVGENVLTIWCSLVPAGPYKVYYVGHVADTKGVIFLSISLESSDADQVLFAKQHAKEAAAGLRDFTLDGYRETGLTQAGQRTQTHFTYKFLIGQPPYDTVREEFQNIANGKTSPISSRTGLIVPQ